MSPSQDSSVSAERLLALPSLSCSLSSLPQAKSVDNVSLHPTMWAHRAAESEAKLKKVLSKTSSHPTSASAYPAFAHPPPADHNNSSSPPLTMRKSQRQK